MDFLNKISKEIIETYLQNNALTNLEKREFASYISGHLRHQGIYATLTEIYRYLNKEIKFDQIRSRLQESFDSKSQEKALQILQDTVL